MDYYFILFKRHWKAMIAAAVSGTVAGSGCSALIIAIIHRQLQSTASSDPLLPWLFGLFILLYYILSAYSEYLFLSLSQGELCHLRLQFSKRVLALPLRRIEEIGGPELMASLTNDVERIARSLRKLPTLFISGSMILGSGIYVAWLSWPLFLITAALLSFGIFMYRLPLWKLSLLQKYWVRLREGWDTLFRHFHSLTHGTKELLIHRQRQEMFFEHCLRDTCLQLRDDAIRGKMIQNLFFRWGDTLYLIVLGLILFVLAPAMKIENQVLMGYIMAGLFILSPLGSLMNFGPNFGEAMIAVEKLKALGVSLHEDVTSQRPETGALTVMPLTDALIRLEGVSYRYGCASGNGEFLLGPLSIEIHKGQTIFIAGGNGSGKTTFMKLLCGLYTPEEGRLLWNEEEVTDGNRESFRQFFSVVFSDFYLFDALLGMESFEKRDEKSKEFLKRLQLDRKVSIKDGCFSTLDLSHGQRKRLALLTAYMEDRPIYIFDEWAADQDPVFKNVFYQTILKDMKERGKTLIVITHDDAWYDFADRIVKLQDGRIVSDEMKRPA